MCISIFSYDNWFRTYFYIVDSSFSCQSKRQASIHQKSLRLFLKDVCSGFKGTATKDAIDQGKAPVHSLVVKQQIVQRKDNARKRKNQIRQEIDGDILLQQRNQRRERVKNEQELMEISFRSKWLAKKLEAESSCVERTKMWMNSTEFKNQSVKNEKEISRTSAMNPEKEKAITSRSVIGYCILDGKMACAGTVPDELFCELKKCNGAITVDLFHAALISCGVHLDVPQISELFHDITLFAPISTKPAHITVQDLYGLRRLSNQYIGEEGSLWKIYQSPIHGQLLFHNISTEKKVLEEDIKKKLIMQIVRENMQSCELLKVRRSVSKAKDNAHELMIHNYAAKSIQYMYHRWKGKACIKNQIWVLERMNLFQTRSRRTNAAIMIQQAFRNSRSSLF